MSKVSSAKYCQDLKPGDLIRTAITGKYGIILSARTCGPGMRAVWMLRQDSCVIYLGSWYDSAVIQDMGLTVI